eukprot:scaffold18292_cov13-Tisochrysis_lutea.AAC.1
MATDKEGKQLAGKMHSGKEGKGGEVRVTDEECHQAWPHAVLAFYLPLAPKLCFWTKATCA